MTSDFPASDWFDDLAARLGKVFPRSETRLRAMDYLKDLLSPCERYNGWPQAEWLGNATPGAAHNELQRWLAGHLRAEDGNFIVDETGFIKKVQHSADVQRQSCGTAGRIENSQVGDHLRYTSPGGSAFLDPEL